jgi:hypothetical protein
MASQQRCPVSFGFGDRNLCFSVDREDASGTDTLLLEIINRSEDNYLVSFGNFATRDMPRLFVDSPSERDPTILYARTRTSFEVIAALLNPCERTCRRYDFSFTDSLFFDGTYVIKLKPEKPHLLPWRHGMHFRTYLPRNVLLGSSIFLSFRLLAREDLRVDEDSDSEEDFYCDDDDDENRQDSC